MQPSAAVQRETRIVELPRDVHQGIISPVCHIGEHFLHRGGLLGAIAARQRQVGRVQPQSPQKNLDLLPVTIIIQFENRNRHLKSQA